MSEDIPVDAESSSRNKMYSAEDHLKHLLKIGYKIDSAIIRNFMKEHQLENVPGE